MAGIYPATYPQMYYPGAQYPVQTAQPNTGITWVQGEAGAKSYLVAPNTTVQLWDSEAQVIYLKSADASGMPNIKILDYTIRNGQNQAPPLTQETSDFATKEELENLAEELASMKRRLDGLAQRRKKEGANNERTQRNATVHAVSE